MPSSLTREEKLAAMRWTGNCFCCPSLINFGHCLAALWQAARQQPRDADALVHWGTNITKFLLAADAGEGPGEDAGRLLLLRAGLLSPAFLGPLLSIASEHAQGVSLTPPTAFAQTFNTGKTVPFASSPQLVMLGLVQHVTSSPAGLAVALAAGRELLPSLLRSLSAAADDRYRCLALQTLSAWLAGASELAAAAAEQSDKEVYGSGGAGAASMAYDALAHALVDAGAARALAGVFRASRCAPVLREAAVLSMGLLAGEGGGGGGGGHHAQDPLLGPGGGHGGGGASKAPSARARLVAGALPAGAALEGRAAARARWALLKAGALPALLPCLALPPSALTYWLLINFGVAGARHSETQRALLVVARTLLLPPAPAAALGPSRGPAAAAAGAPDAASDAVTERERVAAAEAVLACPSLQAYAAEGGARLAEAGGAGEAAGGSAPDRAIELLSRAIRGAAAGRLCPGGAPLDALPPAERNRTPDWRVAARARIAAAAEAARAAAAQAGAGQALEVLTAAMGGARVA